MKKVVIMGAAGRDFHNFNMVFRGSDGYEVVAFTAAQIPGIEHRIYPASLAGRKYPQGIPIYPEHRLQEIIKDHAVDVVVLAYSDLSHEDVMHKASLALSCGADFWLLGPKATMLDASLPVVSVCATRTGAGKSTVARKVCRILRDAYQRVVVVRHPMPYGDLAKQAWQRFSSLDDLERFECTVEEREEYEPHIDDGNIVYAGVDYSLVLDHAQKEADVIVWDGGNNDLPFFQPGLHIVVVDALRPGHEVTYHPGEANLRMADAVVINKVNRARLEDAKRIESNIKEVNPRAVAIMASSEVRVDEPENIRGKRVLVVEDGPTVTHGEMGFGVGTVAAKEYGALELVDPRPYARGSIRDTFEAYPHITSVLPAIGYGRWQIKELEETINSTPCDTIVLGTPVDLAKVAKFNKPYVRVKYELRELGRPDLKDVLSKVMNR